MTEREEILEGLKPLFEKAEKEGLWFKCNSMLAGDIFFSPSELKEQQAIGKFLWDAMNWNLVFPELQLKYLKNKVEEAQKEVVLFELRMGIWELK